MVVKKRNKNAIILGFIMALVIFIVSSLFGYFYIYKQIVKIGEDKNNFSNILKDYNNLKTKGLSYGDYRSLVVKKNFNNSSLKEILSDNYTTNLLVKVDKDFYNSNFVNNGTNKYNNFLDNKIQENKENDILLNFRKKEEQVSSVLPVYVSENDFYSEEGLTDFKFINYIENLLRKYKLKTTSPIGINQLNLVNDKGSKSNETNLEETGIYYIPLKLDLVGTKSNIIDFLTDIYDMGSVVENAGDIEIKNDNHIVESFFIEMKDYIDSSTLNNQENLIKLVTESDQANEKFSIVTELRFYIVGIPSYKIKEEIEKVLSEGYNQEYNYYNVSKKAQSLLKEELGIGGLKKIKDINKYLGGIKKDVSSIIKNINNTKDLEADFAQTLKYKDLFMNIDKELNDILNKQNLN